MAEKRQKIGSFCALKCAKSGGASEKLASVEVFASTEWPDGEPGQYRLRVNRSWDDVDGLDGARYRNRAAVGNYLASLLALMDGETPATLQRRRVHKLEACWVPCGPVDPEIGIQLQSCQARIVSEDTVIGQDGRQYVVVSAVELGGVRLMPLDDVKFYQTKKGKAHPEE